MLAASIAKVVRDQIEGALALRIPSALTPAAHAVRGATPTGIASIDALLGGGLPVGALTEIVGAQCSGRTACAHAFVSQVIQRGQVCAWVDGSDSFDAESAAANGTDLSRVLWVRCGVQEADAGVAAGPAEYAAGPLPSAKPMPGGGSPHPRHEVRGMPEAVDAFLSTQRLVRSKRTIGTPGMPNRSLGLSDRTEQVATDRLPARRGEHVLQHRMALEARCAEPQRRERAVGRGSAEGCAVAQGGSDSGDRTGGAGTARAGSCKAGGGRVVRRSSPWQRLDQALRVTDLLMQAGGFGALVLDLGSLAPELVNRIPLATWFRFRSAADRTRTSVVLLTQHPCSQSSAEVVLRTRAAMPDAGTVLTAVPFTVEIVRQRFRPAPSNVVFLRKPPQRADTAAWSAPATWVGGR